MKTNIILTLGILAFTLGFIGCNASFSTNSNADAKPANSNSAANTTNSNTTASNTSTVPKTDGDTVKIDDGGIQMVIPPGFKHSKNGEDTLVTTPDGGVEILFHVPADGDYDKARMDAAKDIDKYVTNVKIEQKDVKETINGMDALSYSGTGKDKENGKDVNWDLTLFKTDKKPVLAVIYAEKDSIEKNKDGIKAFLESVKKQ